MQAKVNEMFNSISGEVSPYLQGVTTTFLRLSGCNLCCPYCDTDHNDGTMYALYELEEALGKLYKHTGRLCITGGEPLLQEEVVAYVCQKFPNTWIETNGTFDPEAFIKNGIPLVVDCKMFSETLHIPGWLRWLKPHDFVKFVIQDERQLELAVDIHKMLSNHIGSKFAYSVVHESAEKDNLIKRVIEILSENYLTGILNVQIHKYHNLK